MLSSRWLSCLWGLSHFGSCQFVRFKLTRGITMGTMSDEQIKVQLFRSAELKSVAVIKQNIIWNVLKNQGFVEDVVNCQDAETVQKYNKLVKVAILYLPVIEECKNTGLYNDFNEELNKGGRPKSKADYEIEPVFINDEEILSEDDKARSKTLSSYLAWRLSFNDEIRAFRAKFLSETSFSEYLSNNMKHIKDFNSEWAMHPFSEYLYHQHYNEYIRAHGSSILDRVSCNLFLSSPANRLLPVSTFYDLKICCLSASYVIHSNETQTDDGSTFENNLITIESGNNILNIFVPRLYPFGLAA